MKKKKEKKKKSLLHVNLYLQNLYPEEIAGNGIRNGKKED